MNRSIPRQAWIEAGIGLSVAVLALLALASSQPEQHDLPRPLLTGALTEFAVSHGNTSYSVLLHSSLPLIGDGDYRPLGRMRAEEADTITSALRHAKVIEHIDARNLAHDGIAAYGFETGITLTLPGKAAIHLAPAAGGRTYVTSEADASSVEIVDRDLIPLLQRVPDAMRRTDLGIPSGLLAIEHSRGWTLNQRNQRWWLDQGPSRDRANWLDQPATEAWLALISQARSGGSITDPGLPARGFMTFRGPDGHVVMLEDLGPTANGQRLLRRSENIDELRLVETMAIDLDAAVLDPAIAGLQPQRLFPIDPRQASELHLGDLHFSQADGQWSLDGLTATDQELAQQLMTALALLPANTEVLTGTSVISMIAKDGLACEISLAHPDLQRLAGIPAWRFNDRTLASGVSPEAITGLVITPDGAAPQIFSREAGKEWPEEDADDLTDLLAAICSARVTDWTERSPIPGPWDVTMTIATADGQTVRLRLSADGRAAVLNRGLGGTLDRSSQQRLLGAP